jgi:hypothetical protein
MTLVERRKTATHHTSLFRPVSLTLADGVLREGLSMFDYGCGRGSDVRRGLLRACSGCRDCRVR